MTYTQLLTEPIPVWHVAEGHTPSAADAPILDVFVNRPRLRKGGWVAFRGVPIERLDAVVRTGVDVDPTDAPIFCAEESKAWEYARSRSSWDGPGFMFALNGEHLQSTFRRLPADSPPEDISDVQKLYPYTYDDPGDELYFSRLANQKNLAYELHAHWIPGNARDALMAIFLRGPMETVKAALASALAQVE